LNKKLALGAAILIVCGISFGSTTIPKGALQPVKSIFAGYLFCLK
jgi:hypothetical protein